MRSDRAVWRSSPHNAVIRRCRGRDGKRFNGNRGRDPLHVAKSAVIAELARVPAVQLTTAENPHPVSCGMLQHVEQKKKGLVGMIMTQL